MSNLPPYLRSTSAVQPPPQLHVTFKPKHHRTRGLIPTSVIVFKRHYDDGRMLVVRRHRAEKYLWVYLCIPGDGMDGWVSAAVIDNRFKTVDAALAYAETPEAWEF